MGAVQRRNTREGFQDGIREEVQTADFPGAQDGVHLGPHFLNWIEKLYSQEVKSVVE